MSRVVAIVDSSTGKLVDAYGDVREGDRYRRFAKRMLSTDADPVLDYGANGGSRLEISSGGFAGDEVVIKADKLTISGTSVSIGGKTLEEIIAEGGSEAILKDVVGKEGEIAVKFVQDPESPDDPSKKLLQIALDQSVAGKMETIGQAIASLDPDKLVGKAELAEALDGVDFEDDFTLEDVNRMLKVLVGRLKSVAGE